MKVKLSQRTLGNLGDGVYRDELTKGLYLVGISHTLGRCISNIGTPPFSNIGTVRYGAERVKLRRFFSALGMSAF